MLRTLFLSSLFIHLYRRRAGRSCRPLRGSSPVCSNLLQTLTFKGPSHQSRGIQPSYFSVCSCWEIIRIRLLGSTSAHSNYGGEGANVRFATSLASIFPGREKGDLRQEWMKVWGFLIYFFLKIISQFAFVASSPWVWFSVLVVSH